MSHQWYLDNALVAGATDSFLVISKSGNYKVEITGTNGCKIYAGINVVIGLQNYMNKQIISLWPNPIENQFTIHNSLLKIKEIGIFNVLGSCCYKSEIRNSKFEIDVRELPSGIYFVQLIGEKERWVGKFVKE